MDANEALEKAKGHYGRFNAEDGAVKYIDPQKGIRVRTKMALFESLRKKN